MAKLNIKKWSGYLKEHWNKPKDGEYVSIKEFLCMAFGEWAFTALQTP